MRSTKATGRGQAGRRSKAAPAARGDVEEPVLSPKRGGKPVDDPATMKRARALQREFAEALEDLASHLAEQLAALDAKAAEKMLEQELEGIFDDLRDALKRGRGARP